MSYGLHHNAKRLDISVSLGTDRISNSFILGITRAPQAADYPSTFTVQAYNDIRLVAIGSDRFDYQAGRYASFLGGGIITDPALMEEAVYCEGGPVLRKLWERIHQQPDATAE